MNIIDKAINALGDDITYKNRTGKAVIYPARPENKTGSGISESSEGRSEPHKFYIIGTNDLLGNAVNGEIVSDQQNEYYVLWSDTLESSLGGYTKLLARLYEGGAAN